MRKVLIIGGASAIAQATARLFAGAGDRIWLTGRDEDKLAAIVVDLEVRGAPFAGYTVLDSNAWERHGAAVREAIDRLGGLDVVLVAHGTLPDQQELEWSVERVREEFETNGLSVISFLTAVAPHFEKQGHGVIAAISSVAGERGRRSNFVYGSAKAAVTSYMSGLRSRLYGSGVRVVTIKPGFVDTPMTASFRKGILWASPESVGRGIYRAIRRGRPIAYLPWFWGPIMFIIRMIPESIFRRLPL